MVFGVLKVYNTLITRQGGELRHLGVNPIEFNLVADLVLESNPNNVLEVRFRKWNDATSTFENFGNQVRQVNSLVGGRDVAFFTVLQSITLNQNDYVFFTSSKQQR